MQLYPFIYFYMILLALDLRIITEWKLIMHSLHFPLAENMISLKIKFNKTVIRNSLSIENFVSIK